MASQSSSIKVAVKGSGKAVDVSVTAGEHAWVSTARPCSCMCTLIADAQQAMHGLGGPFSSILLLGSWVPDAS